ncbi:serine/threonine-protein kinase [Streptomyces sp. NBC_01803]|uniref:serine/threonine-protein kinase n=1 Tax=Streptomyces sp. NBC_01803 TaxID=2975946 RepID=UPI002DD888F2|nr:serine/threonine-protein kinase [Streptomyces sp. NBC_01803]WSA44893.1 serine/threonine protein kinase [Streptomyces sp. NBC_01803]
MEPLRSQDPAAIGEFTLLARLGAGGMGRVYLGRSPGGILVAVKVIREDIADDPDALARFRREVATVRAVRGAYTADLIGAALDAPPYWLATEFVPGPTLLRATREAPLAPELCTGLFAALAEALAVVHDQGVVHRDVKPHNVILSPAGPRLIDFGIARAADLTRLTRTGQAPGTPGYAAPEVLTGSAAGPAADVFALGATLAAAATGRQPYGDGEWPAVSYRVVHGEIDVDGVHPGLAALIRACVARDPARRPSPREVIRRCGVDWALADVPAYRALTAGAEPPPADLRAATTAGLVPPGHGSPFPARRGRGRGVLATALAVAAIATATTLILLPEGGGDDGTAEDPGALETTDLIGVEPAPPEDDGGTGEDDGAPDLQSGEPPRLNADFSTANIWDSNAGYCLQAAEESLDQFQWSHTREAAGDTVRIGWRLKADLGQGEAPYHVAAAVRRPRTSDTTGSSGQDLVFSSESYDLFEGDPVEWRYVTYPDDFPGAVPLRDMAGDWTVILYHVRAPDDAASIGCDGFTVPGGG